MRRRKRSRESTGNRQSARVWGAAGRCLLLPVALSHVRHWTLSGNSVLWRAWTHSADSTQSARQLHYARAAARLRLQAYYAPIAAYISRLEASLKRCCTPSPHCCMLWIRPSRTGSMPRPPLLAKFLGRSPYFAMSLLQSEPWHLGTCTTCTARKQTHTPLPPGGWLMAMTSCTLLYEPLGKVPLAASHLYAFPSTRSTSRLRDIHASGVYRRRHGQDTAIECPAENCLGATALAESQYT